MAGAPLAAISSLLGLTMGGTTLVGYESCGLELLNSAARLLASGRGADRCLVGACEEHSSLVESLYTSAGWYPDQAPPYLPYPQGDGEVHAGFAMAEGSVFLALSPASQEPGVRYEPVEDPSSFEGEVDLVISGAGGGPQDRHELELLHDLLKRLPRPPSLLFSKPICGEAFAVGPLLSVALGRSVLLGGDAPPPFPLHPRLAYMAEPGPLPRPVKRVLIITADRTGTVEAGLLSCEPSPRVDS